MKLEERTCFTAHDGKHYVAVNSKIIGPKGACLGCDARGNRRLCASLPSCIGSLREDGKLKIWKESSSN